MKPLLKALAAFALYAIACFLFFAGQNLESPLQDRALWTAIFALALVFPLAYYLLEVSDTPMTAPDWLHQQTSREEMD